MRKLLSGAVAAICVMGGAVGAAEPYASLEAWGEALFFDTALSANRTQSCATCHSPEAGFVDAREGAVSLGDDGHSLGDRNAPPAAYASFSPAFHKTTEGKWKGGQFHDGRAATLADQAKGPPLNPIEMGMKDEAAVAERLWANPRYLATMTTLSGPEAAHDPLKAYDAMAEAIAAFEQSETFQPFDSKYDRFLRGEVRLTDEEELGRLLFFSNQFTNCNICHQLRQGPLEEKETFSNYEYHNIGVPANTAVRAVNGVAGDHVDRGLLDNPAVDDPAQAGKFKVPSLRNVAVTSPYMHNGVFSDLRTVVLFYNKYNSKLPERQINPETGAPFAAPEVAQNLSLTELETGPALDDKRIDAIVAFLRTLTDARYEPLLDQ
ncbi:methylamine utilization protein MauG [Sinirhodobacter sp. WL0062]|uniref:Methylamine utilization protein MauG n=1 Tax=Rhodobacter flavimaris TaxID=2907145 RepID=A0ABS8YTR3_9RHOB|nr:cytochrome c peroxidase [Sinirhodobacter sp. WL0062]MCE5971914.1 methylamine utilization protein MauG [Sinirhodobacter sp. WL0062]